MDNEKNASSVKTQSYKPLNRDAYGAGSPVPVTSKDFHARDQTVQVTLAHPKSSKNALSVHNTESR